MIVPILLNELKVIRSVLEIYKKFYVFGGDFVKDGFLTSNSGAPGTRIWCFDAVKNDWSSVGQMLRQRKG